MYSKWLKNVNSKTVIESGHKLQQKASTLGISRGTVSDVIVRFQRRGTEENEPQTGRRRLLDERNRRVLVRQVQSDRKTPLNDATLDLMNIERDRCLKEQFNVLCTKKDTTGELSRKKSGYER